VESVELPTKVDTIICDCFGEMLLNGQMLKSLLIAKKHRFLNSGGKIFPTTGTLKLRPFNDSSYEARMIQDTLLYSQDEFGGLFAAGLFRDAIKERLYRPILDTNDQQRRFATCHEQVFDFGSLMPEKLQRIEFPFLCTFNATGFMTGFTFTFKLSCIGSDAHYFLDTDDSDEPTRWQNVICLLNARIPVVVNEKISGDCQLLANDFHSYDIGIKFSIRREYYEANYRLEYGSSIARNI